MPNMISETNLKELKKIVDEFFKKMGFEVEIETLSLKDETLSLNFNTKEAGILIGEGGQTLFDIQHLLKAILKKNIIAKDESCPQGQRENFYLDLDINNYKKKKTEYLKELAASIAEEVALTKQEKELPAMPSYERRIIHLELAGRSDVATKSVGEEPERRVVVIPQSRTLPLIPLLPF